MSNGLEGVVAAETVLSEVDGAAGRLVIRGYSVEDLAGQRDFRRSCASAAGRLLRRPSARRGVGERRSGAAGSRCSPKWPRSTKLLALTPIEAVRALMARLADGDDLAAALRLIAAPAVFTAGRSARPQRRGADRPRSKRRPRRRHPAHDARARPRRPPRPPRSTPIWSRCATTASTPRPSPRAWSPRPAPA